MPKQHRNRFKCLICNTVVVKVTQHIRGQHMCRLGSEKKCKLWGNFCLLGGKFFSPNGRYYKLCPVDDCTKIVMDVPRHLRDVHSYTRFQSRSASASAVRISTLDWTVPDEPEEGQREGFRDPYPSSFEKRRLQESHRGTSCTPKAKARLQRRRLRLLARSTPAPATSLHRRKLRARPISPSTKSSSSNSRSPSPSSRDSSSDDISKKSTSSDARSKTSKSSDARSKKLTSSARSSRASGSSHKRPGSRPCSMVKEQHGRHMRSTCTDYAKKFFKFLRTERGGKRSRHTASSYRRTIEQFLLLSHCSTCPQKAMKITKVEKYMKDLRKRGLTSSTIFAHLCVFKLFANFLVVRRLISHEKKISLFNELPGIMSNLNREKRVRANFTFSAQMKKVKTLLNLEDFHEKPVVKEALSRLASNPNPHNQKEGKRYLISTLIIDGGARASVIQNITLAEVDMAEEVVLKDGSAYWVIPVHRHKTDLRGVFYIACKDNAFHAIRQLRHTVTNSQYLFCLPNGSQMSSSRVNYEMNVAWTKCGMRRVYGPFNATLNRKRLATKMANISPQLSSKMAKQLRHALNTHQKYYNLIHGPSEAAEIIHEARKRLPEGGAEGGDRTFQGGKGDQTLTYPQPLEEDQHQHHPTTSFTVQAEVHEPPREHHVSEEIQEEENLQTTATSNQRTAEWIMMSSQEGKRELEPPLIATPISPSINSSSVASRRRWSSDDNDEFYSDFKPLILLAKENSSKPMINTVRSMLADINKDKWYSFNENALRDKIWNMAKCLAKHGVPHLTHY